MFGYLPGGYGRFFEVFREHLVQEGVSIRTGIEVRQVRTGGGRTGIVECADGTQTEFDRAVLTVATPVASRLCAGLTDDERARFEKVDYQGIVCASLILKKPLEGYYITNITDSWVPFTAVIEMSALVDRTTFDDHTLVYLPRYLESSDPGFLLSDDEWRERFLPALFRMYPHLSEDDVLAFQVSREKFVYALPTIGYSQHVPPRTTSIPGVHIVNSAQIVNGTLNINESLKLAAESLPEIAAPVELA
jgi:protoporphyrinogen oxidase